MLKEVSKKMSSQDIQQAIVTADVKCMPLQSEIRLHMFNLHGRGQEEREQRLGLLG